MQPSNAEFPILVTLDGITLFLVPAMRVLFEFLMRQFPSLLKRVFPATTMKVSKFGIAIKDLLSIFVTPFPMVIDVRLLQSANVISPILVTLDGMIIEVRLLQP